MARIIGVVMNHPEWALAHKTKGTELRCIRGKYYLYQVSSTWDKNKKRAVKKTGKCLGSISESDGLKPSKTSFKDSIKDIIVDPKIFGAYHLFELISNEWFLPLKKYFPTYYKQIICMAYTRLFKQSPIKNMSFFYEQSFYSQIYKGLPFSDKTITNIIHDIGLNQSLVEAYMNEFIDDKGLVLIDATPIFSKSTNIHEARLGYNNKKQWDTQLNLLYLYSQDSSLPLFFKLSPGDVREVKNLELVLSSSKLKNVILVGDKGFTSYLNMEIINSKNINFILPLRRNSSFIDYSGMNAGKNSMESFFKFKDRYIWYKTKELENKRRVIVFLDDQLKNSEENDYLDRVEKYPNEYSMSEFWNKNNSMGTISTIDNVCDKTPKEIYQTYKSRCEIEQLFDVFKNELDADKTYMHSIEALRGIMFINHLAIIAYYKVYNMLKSSNMLDKFSVKDILEHLYHINAVCLEDNWKVQPISNKTATLLKKLNLTLPITWMRES